MDLRRFLAWRCYPYCSEPRARSSREGKSIDFASRHCQGQKPNGRAQTALHNHVRHEADVSFVLEFTTKCEYILALEWWRLPTVEFLDDTFPETKKTVTKIRRMRPEAKAVTRKSNSLRAQVKNVKMTHLTFLNVQNDHFVGHFFQIYLFVF